MFPLAALATSWLIYGFGELIDKATEIAENTSDKTKKKEETKTTLPIAKVHKPIVKKTVGDIKTEMADNTEYVDVLCPTCGQELSFSSELEVADCPWCNTTLEIK